MSDAQAPDPALDLDAEDWPDAPRHWEADVVAADGGIVHLRPIRPSDADALVTFHAGLSQRTRYLRYFSAYPRIPPKDLYRFTHVDHRDRVAFVAELAGQIIAVGRYEREPGTDEAEVAFVVADAHQGRGIGSVLLEHLAAAARERGLRRFKAIVLAENDAMIRVFRLAGYETTRHVEYGEVTLEFDVDETALTESVMREREQRAEARSIGRLLRPAVGGGGRRQQRPVQDRARGVPQPAADGAGRPAVPGQRRCAARRRGAGLPVGARRARRHRPRRRSRCPRRRSPGWSTSARERGVRGLVVLSGGYGERGSDDERAAGRAAQRALVQAARQHGMRVVGPNCLGVINTAADVRLNASLAPLPPLAGRAGFFCQSGALGVAVLGEASRRGLGVSTFVSAGNRADVSGNDLLQYWESDPATDVVLMYLESFGNPRKFGRLARRLGRTKPIVAVKGGAGMVVPGLAYTSVEVPEVSVRALFEQSGVIRVDTVGDLFDVALLLTSQPLPVGRRIAVVGNSTALGALVTNALAEEGLQLARLDDIGVEGHAADLERTLAEALHDDGVDAAVVVFVPPLQQESSEAAARALRTAAEASGKPVLSTFLGFEGVPAGLAAEGEFSPTRGSVPSYASPERAVRALGRAVRYSVWRQRDPGVVPSLAGFDVAGGRAGDRRDPARGAGRPRPGARRGAPAARVRRRPAGREHAVRAERRHRRRAHRARRQVLRRAGVLRCAGRGHRAARRPRLRDRPAHDRRRRRSDLAPRARRRCSTVTAAGSSPTAPRSRTSRCGCRRSPRRDRRSPSARWASRRRPTARS